MASDPTAVIVASIVIAGGLTGGLFAGLYWRWNDV